MKLKFKGKPVTLSGRGLRTGEKASDFRIVSQDLRDFTLADFQDKIKVITTFLSLDTSVCDLQIKEFNKNAFSFSSEVVVLGISMDLPFAQERFCKDNSIKNVSLFSDYKYSSVGINYGLLVKELNLLARSIVILDKNNIIRYAQIVEELSGFPDYADALKALKGVIEKPAVPIKEELPGKCVPCKAGTPALSEGRVNELIPRLDSWELIEGKKIAKEYKFEDFSEAKFFLDEISFVAEEQGHHPVMTLSFNKLKVSLTTHAAGGLTDNDFIMAGIIDDIYRK